MMVLIPFLAIALAVLMKDSLKGSSAAPAPNPASSPVTTATTSEIDIAWEIPPLYPADRRDPMQLPAPSPVSTTVEAPVVAPVQTRVGLVVTGILYSDDRPMAIVNTQLVLEGQQIAGVTVKHIGLDGVEFELNGQAWKQAVDK